MAEAVKIKSFKATTPEILTEEVNSFSDVREVIATQTHFAEGLWVAFCYYKQQQ